MYGFLRKRVIHRDSAIRSICSNSNSFTVTSYLINSCGLSQKKAVSVSKKLHFKTPTKPDSVLTFLKNNGFTKTHISKIVQKFPKLLSSKTNKTLKPKFDYFNSKGLHGPDLAHALSMSPFLLHSSLEKTIIPCFDILKSIFQTESKVVSMLKRPNAMVVLERNPQTSLLPNVTLLRAYGVPDSKIEYLFVNRRSTFRTTAYKFSEIVKEVSKMEIDPSQYKFVLMIKALTYMTKSTLDAKFDVYRRWGWSESEIQLAWRKEPCCMMLSEKNIIATMDYFVNKMGYDTSYIAKQPLLLLFSLERRIIPRCSVIQVLIANGLVKKACILYRVMNISEREFLKQYVAKFEEKVPEVLNAYQVKGIGKV